MHIADTTRTEQLLHYETADFNGALELFNGRLAERWREIDSILVNLRPQLQASDEERRRGLPIFSPKATNAHLTTQAATHGWRKVPVPEDLTSFGVDWDAGKDSVLAEWQFSNYPFLWNAPAYRMDPASRVLRKLGRLLGQEPEADRLKRLCLNTMYLNSYFMHFATCIPDMALVDTRLSRWQDVRF